MAGFLAALGPALTGIGEGLKERAMAQREQRIAELKERLTNERLDKQLAASRAEGDADRIARAKDAELDRAALSQREDAARKHELATGGELVTAEDGSTWSRSGSTMTPIKTPDGKDFKSKPTKRDSVEFDIEKAVEDAVKTELGDAYGERSPATVEAARERNRYRIRTQMGMDATPPAAPRNPELRITGQVYATPDGRTVKWTGEGWELVSK